MALRAHAQMPSERLAQRCCEFHVDTGPRAPTTDVGYTTAGSTSGALTRSVAGFDGEVHICRIGRWPCLVGSTSRVLQRCTDAGPMLGLTVNRARPAIAPIDVGLRRRCGGAVSGPHPARRRVDSSDRRDDATVHETLAQFIQYGVDLRHRSRADPGQRNPLSSHQIQQFAHLG